MPKKTACLSPEADRCLYIKRFPGVGPTINLHFFAATASCRNFSSCLRWSLAPGFLLHSFPSQSVVFRGDVATLLSFQSANYERRKNRRCIMFGPWPTCFNSPKLKIFMLIFHNQWLLVLCNLPGISPSGESLDNDCRGSYLFKKSRRKLSF